MDSARRNSVPAYQRQWCYCNKAMCKAEAAIMIRRVFVGCALVLLMIQTAGAMTPEERKEYRDKLLQTLPPVTGRGGRRTSAGF
jgi:hypothetical protein